MCDMITTQNKKEIEDSLIAGRMPENPHEILVKDEYKEFWGRSKGRNAV